MESHIKPGVKIAKTVDLATDAGSVVLMHRSKTVLERDIALIRQMEASGALFQLVSDDDSNCAPKESTKMGTARPRSCSMTNFSGCGIGVVLGQASSPRLQ
jgi:hypothetical protein